MNTKLFLFIFGLVFGNRFMLPARDLVRIAAISCISNQNFQTNTAMKSKRMDLGFNKWVEMVGGIAELATEPFRRNLNAHDSWRIS